MADSLKTLFVTGLLDARTTDVEGVGVLRFEPSGRVYRWVKNASATAIVAENPVCYDVSNAGSKAIYNSVIAPVTADLMANAGIAMTAIAVSGGVCFAWVQVQGYHEDAACLDISGSAIAVGDELNTANGVNTITRVTAVGTAPIYRFTYYALETSSGDTGAAVSKDVYIACL